MLSHRASAAERELWFSEDEYRARLSRLRARLAAAGLDGLIACQAESVTWLTGYFTRAYGAFQLVVLSRNRDPVIVCRDRSAYYIDRRSAFPDCVVWVDGQDPMNAALEAIGSVFEDGGAAKPTRPKARIGVEMGAWHLSWARGRALEASLPGADLIDVGHLVARLRLVKSPAEIAYQRAAARAAEAGMEAAATVARAGISEREIAAEVCAAMVRAGSDEPGPGVLSSGERARELHGGYSDRVLEVGDTLQFEATPNVRQYHARFMRTFKIGSATKAERRAFEQLVAVQDQALSAVAPGVPAALPDRIYREGVAATGLVGQYVNKTFYSIGLILRPSGGEPLEATPDCGWRFEAGMTFHTYLLVDGFGVSESILITESGCELLTRYPRELIVTG